MPLACPAEFPAFGYTGAPAQDSPFSCPAASPPGRKTGSVLYDSPRVAEIATIRRASRRHSKNVLAKFTWFKKSARIMKHELRGAGPPKPVLRNSQYAMLYHGRYNRLESFPAVDAKVLFLRINRLPLCVPTTPGHTSGKERSVLCKIGLFVRCPF